MSTEAINLGDLVPSRCERLVAAEPDRDGTATLFTRGRDDRVVTETVEYQPWLLVTGKALAEAVPGAAHVQHLGAPVGSTSSPQHVLAIDRNAEVNAATVRRGTLAGR